MVRTILAVIAGFLAWSIVWIGSDSVLMMLSPAWYGAHQMNFQQALALGAGFTPDNSILAMHIIRSVLISIMAGYLAAVISGESSKAPLWLGILLLLFGLAIQLMAWSYLPIWYHLIFLALLIPMTVLGGRLRSKTATTADAV
jgi:hypothetical protein